MRFFIAIFLLVCMNSTAQAQRRTVAITVDDLPYANGGVSNEEASVAETVNRRLLAAFREQQIPVTGFVVQQGVESLGAAGVRILEGWIGQGFDLGNHTYSHPEINALSIAEIEAELIRGEPTIRRLMQGAGKKLAYLRFPQNHTGDTKPKHDAIASFLAAHGYQVATCTIDTSDYVFNEAYVHMLASGDQESARKLRQDYLAYSATQIDYYASLNRQVFGSEPAEVMLLHANRLNADVIDRLLGLFRERGYKFVSLAEAQSDSAYQTPDTYVTKFGPMWGYRWAATRGIKVNGSLETDPPQWIVDFNTATRKSAQSPLSH
jgi:peptidoglycan/xylan/chitin deacetylase (PgdA/CDA1 family)